MKIGVVVAAKNALPSAFVVFRGIERGICKAAELGYDGIELAVRGGDEFEPEHIKKLLSENGLEIAAVSTGQLFADRGLWLSARDTKMREKAVREFCGIIDLAANLGCLVNIGRARGFIESNDTREETTKRFFESMTEIASHAADNKTTLVLEPVNRYETNYINSVTEGAALVKAFGIDNLLLMPDVFHMNIEDVSIEQSIMDNGDIIGYVHLADSNRLAPGWGHLNFEAVAAALGETEYDRWVTVEIFPQPSPEEAAAQAINYLRRFYPSV